MPAIAIRCIYSLQLPLFILFFIVSDGVLLWIEITYLHTISELRRLHIKIIQLAKHREAFILKQSQETHCICHHG